MPFTVSPMNLVRRLSKKLVFALLFSLLAFLYIGVQGANAAPTAPATTAQAAMGATSGKAKLTGQITFTDTPKGLAIQAAINNAPSGFHGFHIHEKASCRDSGKAAGGHFNPNKAKHGKLLIDGFANAHAGDLGNILIGADGKGTFSQTIPGLSVAEGKYPIANHAVILHAQRDDFSQPVGNAGDRIGCGVINVAQTPQKK